jgi:hypothetical protein
LNCRRIAYNHQSLFPFLGRPRTDHLPTDDSLTLTTPILQTLE